MDRHEVKALVGALFLDSLMAGVVMAFGLPIPTFGMLFFGMFAYIGCLAFFSRNVKTYASRHKKP